MNPTPSVIAHFDLDAFFVSVERLNDPGLRGKPLLVGGHRERGVVAACSYEARKFGIHSAMPMKTAMRLCPGATVLSGNRTEYSKYSRWVTGIISSEAPLFEKASIDEFYLDLTGMTTYFDPYQWTIRLREKIIQDTGLDISFGLASNKMVAKIATDEAKPNGYLHIPWGCERTFLAPLSLDKIPGIGKQTYQTLQTLGMQRIRDLQDRSLEWMQARLGRHGGELWEKAQGIHRGIVLAYHDAKSVSTENTFEENTADTQFLLAELVRMTEKIAYELRKENKTAGCLSVKIRYPNFETTSRQISLPYTFYDDELIVQAKELFGKLYRRGQPVRLLGVRLSELTDQAIQTNLFENAGKKTGLYQAIDEVKNRFGRYSVKKAGGM